MKIRINTSSTKVASFTKNYLSRKLNYPFTYAVSSRNILMLDFDATTPSSKKLALDEAKSIGMALVDEYGGRVCVYETPNGYHLIYYRFMRWNRIKRIIRFLITSAVTGKFAFIDLNHLRACLRRNYMTLRLNRQKRVWCYKYGVSQVF